MRIKDLEQGEKSNFPHEMTARKLTVIALQDLHLENLEIKRTVTSKKNARATLVGAKYLGQILGKRLHQGILEETVDMALMNEVYLKNKTDTSDTLDEYEYRYRKLIQAINEVKIPPSKLASF